MKKFLLLFGALLVFHSAVAQGGAFGVKAGINYSGAFGSGVDVDPKTGFVGGIYGLLEGRRIGLQAELLYSRQGFKDKTEPEGHTRNYMLNYLEIPLIVKIYPFRWISIDAGYQTAILLDTGREKIKIGSRREKSDMQNMRSINNSVVLGLSFRLGRKVDLSARYLLGISDLQNKDEGDMLRSRAGQFTLGYRF